jgi:polyisoprenoid-binding protein YceI
MKKVIYCLSLILVISCENKDTEGTEQRTGDLNKTKGISMVAGDTLWVNPKTSNIHWIGHKVTGEHSGHIKIAGGFVLKNAGIISGGEVLVDMQSITVEDIETPKWNQKLVDHLKADDFFNSDEYPIARLNIMGSSSTDITDIFTLKGELNIRDKTNPIEFNAMVNFSQDSSMATGTLKVDRTLYDVKYRSGKFFDGLGDKMIYDEFTLNFSIIAN